MGLPNQSSGTINCAIFKRGGDVTTYTFRNVLYNMLVCLRTSAVDGQNNSKSVQSDFLVTNCNWNYVTSAAFDFTVASLLIHLEAGKSSWAQETDMKCAELGWNYIFHWLCYEAWTQKLWRHFHNSILRCHLLGYWQFKFKMLISRPLWSPQPHTILVQANARAILTHLYIYIICRWMNCMCSYL